MRDWYLGGWRSVSRTVRGAFAFGGRSRVVDVVWYWLVAMAVGALISWPADLLPWDAEWYAKRGIDIVLGLPFFALFARRLHDQGFSGWWALLLLPFPPINLYQSYRANFAVLNPSWLNEPDPLRNLGMWPFALLLVLLVVLLRPGMQGSNRYGGDPRDAAVA